MGTGWSQSKDWDVSLRSAWLLWECRMPFGGTVSAGQLLWREQTLHRESSGAREVLRAAVPWGPTPAAWLHV